MPMVRNQIRLTVVKTGEKSAREGKELMMGKAKKIKDIERSE